MALNYPMRLCVTLISLYTGRAVVRWIHSRLHETRHTPELLRDLPIQPLVSSDIC